MNLDLLKRLSQDLDGLTSPLEGVAHRADDLLTEEVARAHGQGELPGLGEQGAPKQDPCAACQADMAGLRQTIGEMEGEIAELEQANTSPRQQLADARAEVVRLNEVCADTVAEREAAEERAQNLLTALHLVTDASKLATAKSLARRAVDEYRQAREAANAKMHAAAD